MSSTVGDQSEPVKADPSGYPPAQPSHPPSYPPAYYGYPTTAHAYHCTAPPQASYCPPQPCPAPPHNPQRSTSLRSVITIIIAIFVFFVFISFIIWLVLRPQIPWFRVDSLSISNFNISNSQFTANWDVGLTVQNSNTKLSMFYDSLEASMLYRESLLSVTTLAPFSLEKMNQTTVHAKFSANSNYVEEWMAKDMASDQRNGTMSFNVRMIISARYISRLWVTGTVSMRIFCERLKVGFSSSTGEGSLMGGASECLVG